MTLREFASNFMEVNNITTSVDEMLAKIKDVARDRAQKGVAVMDEEDVEAVILGKVEPKAKPVAKAETAKTKKEEEKDKKAIAKLNVRPLEAEPKKAKKEKKDEKKPEVEQLGLFDEIWNV